MRTLILATTGVQPLTEVQMILRKSPFALLLLRDIHHLNMNVEGTGMMCAENARSQTHTYAQDANIPGRIAACALEQSAPEGAAGMYSAWFAGRSPSSMEHLRKAFSRRTARFCCVRALAGSAENMCVLAEVPVAEKHARGEHASDYDPIFFVPGYGRPTTARRAPEEKQRISHRGCAAQAACRLLGNWPVH
jgi:XTP/dITP diphosphohydrolase